MKLSRNKLAILFLILAASAGFVFLLYPGIPKGHDLPFHLARIDAIRAGMADGIFPVRINFGALDGFGYATGLFYPDLFTSVPAAFALAGASLIGAYKIFLLLWGILSVLSMYFCLRRMKATEFGAAGGAMLYLWSSYFSIDIFTRAALGEVTAFPFLPPVILGMYRLVYEKKGKLPPLVFGFAGLFLSHQITFVLMALFALIFCAFTFPRFLREPGKIAKGIGAGILFLALTAFFWAPMMEQMHAIRFNLTGMTLQSPAWERTVPFLRLFLELPYTGLAEWMPPGLGLVLFLVAFRRFGMKTEWRGIPRYRDCVLIAGVFALLFATDFMPWEGKVMKPLAAVQFPWRSYLPATAFFAFAGGLLLSEIRDFRIMRRWSWILLLGCGFAWFFNSAYAYAAKIHEKQIIRTFQAEDAGRLAASGLHYLPAGVNSAFLEAFGSEPRSGNGDLKMEFIRTGKPGVSLLKFSGNTGKGRKEVELPLTPYVGYRAETCAEPSAEKQKDPVGIGLKYGKTLTLLLPDGMESGCVKIYYAGTAVQKYSLLLSLLTLIFAAGIPFIRKIRNRGESAG